MIIKVVNITKMALMLFVMALVLSACHSKKAVTSGGGSYSHSGHNHHGSRVTISDEWSTLDVELDKDDNKKLYQELKGWLGTPYLYGGNTKSGVDCSGLVCQVYKKVYKINLERNSAKIFEKNCTLIDVDDMREGDLLFFHTTKKPGTNITHVGIYLKDNKFVHASSSKGVMVSDITQNYWIDHFVAVGRVVSM